MRAQAVVTSYKISPNKTEWPKRQWKKLSTYNETEDEESWEMHVKVGCLTDVHTLISLHTLPLYYGGI